MLPERRILPQDVTLVVLAGGRGQRMQGQDKGLLVYRGRRLVDRVCDALSKQTKQIMISANRNLEQYRQTGFPVISDSVDGYQGPLAGMLSAMQQATTRWILSVPCDSPNIADDYVDRMLSAAQLSDCEVVVASDGARIQPVYALLATRLAGALESYLASGQRRTGQWLSAQPHATAHFDQASGIFTNFNTPADLRGKS